VPGLVPGLVPGVPEAEHGLGDDGGGLQVSLHAAAHARGLGAGGAAAGPGDALGEALVAHRLHTAGTPARQAQRPLSRLLPLYVQTALVEAVH